MMLVADDIQRLAAFHDRGTGGNPASVARVERMPDEDTMHRLVAGIGYAEIVFAHSKEGAWRVRYSSPEPEVPFCVHATIALVHMRDARHHDVRNAFASSGVVEDPATGAAPTD